MRLFGSFFLIFILHICLSNTTERVYVHQFPLNSEHLKLPRMVIMSIFMGKLKYSYFALTLESMKWNPMVDFIVINIIEDNSDEAVHILEMSKHVPNFQVVVLSMTQWRNRVKDRLSLEVPFDKKWFYKLCEYKPTLAYLFPEIVNKTEPSGSLLYKYWGYGDLDVIWGNWSRFAHWFQEDKAYPFIISGYFGTTGAMAMYLNEAWTQELFLRDPVYKSALKDFIYHNLDEGGTQVDQTAVLDEGDHSISKLQKEHERIHGTHFHYGARYEDRILVDGSDSEKWAGPISWVRGSLKILQSSNYFPHGREILLFHRPTLFDLPANITHGLLEDMKEYGYLLPNLIPILTRYICANGVVIMSGDYKGILHEFIPYKEQCFGKIEKIDGSFQQSDDKL